MAHRRPFSADIGLVRSHLAIERIRVVLQQKPLVAPGRQAARAAAPLVRELL
jgi:hypothetical protein